MKDWVTLKMEDGPVGRYLLGLEAKRREQWNRDLERILLQGGTMSLRDEVLARGAAAIERTWPSVAADMRRGELSDTQWQGVKVMCAVLLVIDEYEEVEARVHKSGEWAYLPHDGRPASYQTSPSYDTYTIFMRKQKPAPDVEELARRAVKAYREPRCTAYDEAMEALEKKLDR